MSERILRSIGFVSVAAVMIAACGESSGPGSDSGAASGGALTTGGGTGVGGTPGVGGIPGTGGGTPGAGGGAPGTGGGTPGTGGGAPGTGGASAGGGAPGTGGAAGGDGGSPGTGGASSPDPTVHLDNERQLIRGFGINNNWAPLGQATAQKLYGNGDGQLGMNILRVGMGTDGNPYNGQSCYDDIDYVADIVGGRSEPHYIMATLWSPPANCKSDGTINDGGHLLESCYGSWSDTIAAFADKVATNTNTTLYAMSPQNETDFASCGRQEPCNGNYDTTVMTGKEAADFQKIVGPKLRAKGVIPMSAEASEWIHVWSNESATGSEPSGLGSSDPLNCGFPAENPDCLTDFGGYDYGHALAADPDAWAAFDIMGTHQYDSQIAYPWPDDGSVPERGDKEVWQTEMSGVKWWPEQGDIVQDSSANGGWRVSPTVHIENGVAVARWIHSGLVVGEANAWLYWWYQAIDTDDNEGLVTKDGRTAKRFYTFGNFSKFVRPDYHRVVMTGDFPEKVLVSAYKGPDGTVVIVAINETTTAQDIPITISGGTAPAEMTPYLTSATADIAAQTAVPVTAGVLAAALPPMSVTTYVGQ